VAAPRTAAQHADQAIALLLVPERPPDAHVVWGDAADADPAPHPRGAAAGRLLITPGRGPDPHADAGVEVRRLLHPLRALAIATGTEPLKGLCAGQGQVPTNGLRTTRRFALGAILVSQLRRG